MVTLTSSPAGTYTRKSPAPFYGGGQMAMPPVRHLQGQGPHYTFGETATVGLLASTTLRGVSTYLNRLPDDQMIKSVSFGVEGGSLWIVTEVEAEGSLDRLDALFEAEAAARHVADVALVFRILDRSLGEDLQDGPRDLTPIRK